MTSDPTHYQEKRTDPFGPVPLCLITGIAESVRVVGKEKNKGAEGPCQLYFRFNGHLR